MARLPRCEHSFNPDLRRWLRDVDNDRWAGRAFIPRAVYGGHGVPIAVTGLYRRITIRGRGQQFRGQKLAPCALLLTSIDAISGQIGFKIYGPREVNKNRARCRAGKQGGDKTLRSSGGKDILRTGRDSL